MTVTLYNNSSAYNVLYKSLGTAIASVTATVKGSCSIDNPTLLLNYNSAASFNYFYISEWSRYYKVTNRLMVPGEHMIVSGISDPIQSFNSGIAALDVLILRAEDPSLRSPYLTDSAIPVPADPQYEVIEGETIIGSGTGMYVIGVV